jgi:hypothetical protein
MPGDRGVPLARITPAGIIGTGGHFSRLGSMRYKNNNVFTFTACTQRAAPAGAERLAAEGREIGSD